MINELLVYLIDKYNTVLFLLYNMIGKKYRLYTKYKMKTIRNIILLLLLPIVGFSNNQIQNNKIINERIDSISKDLFKSNIERESLHKEFEMLQSNYECQKEIMSQSSNSIGNQIEAGNRTITIWSIIIAIFGIILGILGVILGVYISKKVKQVTKIQGQVKKIEVQTQKLLRDVNSHKKSVEALDEKMHNRIAELYEDFRREETNTYLNRLVDVPEDIANIIKSLLSRELIYSDYEKVKKAYCKLKNECEDIDTPRGLGFTYREQYLLIFFQHFLNQSIQDNDIRDEVMNSFKTGCDCSYKNDIIKSTKDLMIGINSNVNIDKQNILKEYIIALNDTKHKKLIDVFNIIIDDLDNKDAILILWQNLIGDHPIVIKFGEALIEKYNNNINLTDQERSLIASIQQKLDEEKGTHDNV